MKNLKELLDSTPAEQKKYIEGRYYSQQQSFEEIAKELGTYSNKVRRLAVKLGVKPKSQSEAQKQSLQLGKRKHPTEGKERSEETKLKISETQAKVWDGLSKKERNERAEKTREQYESMTKEEKKKFLELASIGMRKAAKEGSILEKYLYQKLKDAGWYPEMHREQQFVNERLHIDIYIKKTNTSIEVDGPSHFKPVWGNKTLTKKQGSDKQKNGLILGAGGCLIRIKHAKEMSEKKKRDLFNKVVEILTNIEAKYPTKNNRYFEIEA